MGVILVASSPSLPAFAHAGEDTGVSIEFVLIGAGLMAAAFFSHRMAGAKRWVPPVLGVLGVALVAGGLVVVPRLGGDAPSSSDAVVDIVHPAPDARVPADKPVTIEVALRNAPLATSPTSESGGHLHLYVDGKLQQMPYSRRIDVDLEPGRHEITVEYVDEQHLSFDPPVQQSVSVTAR